MNEDRKHIEFENENEVTPQKESSIFRGLIDGTLLTRRKVVRQLPFIFYLVFLGLIYISNRYHAETLRNRIEDLRETTNELRSQAIFVSSELMKLSRQTEVADEVERKGLNLKESVEPPKKIVVKEKK
ncbi:MAG: FtsL-like putative cell division protein [Bacteroidales bacterium]